MNATPTPAPSFLRPEYVKAGAIAALYGICAAIWIMGPDIFLDDDVGAERIELFLDAAFVLASTLLLFLTLAHGLREAARNTPFSRVVAPRYTTRRMAVTFCALALLAPLIGTSYVALRIPQIEQDTYAHLETIARLNTEQIENWLRERQTDVEMLSKNPLFLTALKKSKDGSRSERTHWRDELAIMLGSLKRADKHDRTVLFDADQKPLLSDNGEVEHLNENIFAGLAAASREQKTQLGEISLLDGDPHLHITTPLFASGTDDKRLIGFIDHCTNLNDFILPQLKNWPTSSPSGETLLVRKQDDHITIISALRHLDAPPLTVSIPLTRTDMPSVHAVLDADSGRFMGPDYRAVNVLAAYRPIAGTDWKLLATIDRKEVLSPMWRTVFWIGLVSAAAALAVMWAFIVLWRERELVQTISLMSEQAKNDQLLQSFFTLPFIGMAIVSPSTRKFLRFNDQACEITGYSREELLELTWQDISHPDDVADFYPEILRIRNGEVDSAMFEQRLVRKDGTLIYVNANVRCVRKSDGTLDYLLGTVQDITPRKMHEMAISVANAQLKANQAELRTQNEKLLETKAELEASRARHIDLYEHAPIAYFTLTSAGHIKRINQTACKLLGFRHDAVNGFKTTVPDDELFLVIVDCGGPALLAALAIFAATPALAADKHAGHSHAAPAAATLVDGTVKKVDKAAGKLTLSHGPLPNGMPAMTMAFGVKMSHKIMGEAVDFVPDDGIVQMITVCARRARYVREVRPSVPLNGSDDATLMIRRVQSQGGRAGYFLVGAGLEASHEHAAVDFDERYRNLRDVAVLAPHVYS